MRQLGDNPREVRKSVRECLEPGFVLSTAGREKVKALLNVPWGS